MKINMKKLTKEDVKIAWDIQLNNMQKSNEFLNENEINYYLNKSYSIKELEVMIDSEDDSLYLGYHEDKAISFLTMMWNIEYSYVIIYSLGTKFNKLDVIYEYQSQGVGTQMICNILPDLINKKIDRIYLGTHVENKKALELYKKMGYIEQYRKLENYGEKDKDHVVTNGYFEMKNFVEKLKSLKFYSE
jgi:GNAT superfamily N-acetyltransferase